MRILITILAICAYVVSFNVYIYEINKSYHYSKLIYSYTTLGMLLFYHFNQKSLCSIVLELNNVVFLSVMVNLTLVLFTHHDLFTNPKKMFYIFNGLMLLIGVLTLLCLIPTIRLDIRISKVIKENKRLSKIVSAYERMLK